MARYAVKFAGAAHLKAETLADLIGKSVKTARRVVNKLASLSIVQKVATTRKINGGKGANIIVILLSRKRRRNRGCPVDNVQSRTSREANGDNGRSA
ncbi:helix-turn-helix domain-containing protein [Bacillus sonorensis]|nr:helix-turn-helix domain-containing protein [Bacillus sonorensis]